MKTYERRRKMRAALVMDGLRMGGIERVGLDYISILKNLGYDVDIYNLRPKLTELEKEVPDDCNILHINYPRWLAPERYGATLKKAWWGKYIYPIAYCVMSCANMVYLPIIRWKNRRQEKKYDLAIAFSGHVNDLTFIAKSYIKSAKKVAWLHGALYSYAIISPSYLQLYKKIKNIVSLSDMCDANFKEYMEDNEINKKTIYNPLYIGTRSVDQCVVDELEKKYGDFCLMVARMETDKDQKTAIDAIRLLNNSNRWNKKLLLVGDGSQRALLEKYVAEHNMEDQIIFAGQRYDVQNFYSAASIYVHSSPLEGLPTVLLEAMNYEVPIAATDSVPGVREILRDGEGGLISPIADADALAKNIYKLYTDKELVFQIIQRQRERRKAFAPEVVQNHLNEFIQNLR